MDGGRVPGRRPGEAIGGPRPGVGRPRRLDYGGWGLGRCRYRYRYPDFEAGTWGRVIVWLVVGTDVRSEVRGAQARREGSMGLGQMMAALQGLAAQLGARPRSCAGERFISLSRHVQGAKPAGIGKATSCPISFSF